MMDDDERTVHGTYGVKAGDRVEIIDKNGGIHRTGTVTHVEPWVCARNQNRETVTVKCDWNPQGQNFFTITTMWLNGVVERGSFELAGFTLRKIVEPVKRTVRRVIGTKQARARVEPQHAKQE